MVVWSDIMPVLCNAHLVLCLVCTRPACGRLGVCIGRGAGRDRTLHGHRRRRWAVVVVVVVPVCRCPWGGGVPCRSAADVCRMLQRCAAAGAPLPPAPAVCTVRARGSRGAGVSDIQNSHKQCSCGPARGAMAPVPQA